MAVSNKVDLKKYRSLIISSLFIIAGVVIYTVIYQIIFLLLVLLMTWFLYDYLRENTKDTIDPAGKYVFITGCDTGFGLESAKAIRDLGFNVIAGCYDDHSDGALELKGRPWVKKVEVISLDVASEASVRDCVEEIKEICQHTGLWAVINNAGINSLGPTELTSMETYKHVAEVNLFSAIRVTKSCLPLIRQAKGRIINITSERAFNPWKNNSCYCLSKHSLEAYTACLRSELKPFGVTAISIAPGHFSGGTAIASSRRNEVIVDGLTREHSRLSLQDQEHAYTKTDIESFQKALETADQSSCTNIQPVIQAYIDAVSNSRPKSTYFVQGTTNVLDGYIIMARIRPFVPERLISPTENLIQSLFC